MADYLETMLRLGRQPRWLAWGLTSLMVLVAFLARLAIDPIYPYPFLTFVPAVFLAALLFDRGSSFIATGQSLLLVLVFFMEPRGAFAWPGAGQVLGLLLFTLVSVTIGILTERLRSALEENARLRLQGEVLLRELNHRIRNDLQRVNAMLMMEAQRGPTSDGLQTIAERISVLGEVYGRLTPLDGQAAVAMDGFLEGVVEGLRHSYQDGLPIGLRLQAEPLILPLGPALVLGLAVNELVLNAFKYAFPDGRAGSIEVRLWRLQDEVVLDVTDDGVGFDPAATARGTGLGRALVEQLVRQHGGDVVVSTEAGVQTRIRLPLGQGRMG